MSRNFLVAFWELSFSKKIAAIRVAILLHVVFLAIRLFRFDSIDRYLSSLKPRRSVFDEFSSAELVDLVKSCSWRMPWTGKCLTRALSVYYLMIRAGYRVDLNIGVKHDLGQGIMAHAWIEDEEGKVVAEELEDLSSFEQLFKLENQRGD